MGSRATRIAQVCALLLLPCGMLGGLTACQTRLLGARTPDYDLPRGANSGIPFRLARPVFIIQRTLKTKEDGTKELDKYELVVEYRSDPTAVYWVNVDPALFHKSSLALTFGRVADGDMDDPNSHGFLTQMKLNGADKSKEFLAALGTFATESVGLYVLSRGNQLADDRLNAYGSMAFAFANNAQAMGFDFETAVQPFAGDLANALGPAVPASLGVTTAEAIRLALDPKAVVPRRLEADLALLRQHTASKLRILTVKDLTRFMELTGIELRYLYKLYRENPPLLDIMREALNRPEALPGSPQAHVDELATLKTKIRGELSFIPLTAGFTANAYAKANVAAHLQLLEHHRFIDSLKNLTQPSTFYVDVERRLFAAANWRAGWDEHRRLEEFLESGTPLYETTSPRAPDPGFVHELKQAAERVLEIDGKVRTMAAKAALWKDPSTSSYSPPKDLIEDWTEKAHAPMRPRWVYQEQVPGPVVDRGEWLRLYLERFHPNCEPEDGEFVVLVERSYPDREVRPDGRILGQVTEIQMVPKETAEPCQLALPASPTCKFPKAK
jgi:hypothetical protein